MSLTPSACRPACERSDAPSAYVVGRDPSGIWVAVETHGRAGGLFRSQEAATDYAAFETCGRPDGVRISIEPVTLRIGGR